MAAEDHGISGMPLVRHLELEIVYQLSRFPLD